MKSIGRILVILVGIASIVAGIWMVSLGFWNSDGLTIPFRDNPWLVIVVGVLLLSEGAFVLFLSPKQLFLISLFGPGGLFLFNKPPKFRPSVKAKRSNPDPP